MLHAAVHKAAEASGQAGQAGHQRGAEGGTWPQESEGR